MRASCQSGSSSRLVGVPIEGRLPVALVVRPTVGLDHPNGGRRELADAGQDGAGRRDDRVEGHVTGEGLQVDRAVGAPHGHEGGQGGGKAEPLGGLVEVQRLDAEAVSGRAPAGRCPARRRRRQTSRRGGRRSDVPHCSIGLGDDLGVGVGEEAVAEMGELRAKGLVVVDAAVEDDGEPELGVDHGLGSGRREVDDGQPAMGECYWARSPYAPSRPALAAPACRAALDRTHVRGRGRRSGAHRRCRTLWPSICSSVRIQVSLAPPPREELTIMLPCGATRVRASPASSASSGPVPVR